jgi:hypothetical protein
VPHLLWHGASVFPVSFEGPPHSIAFYDTQGDAEGRRIILSLDGDLWSPSNHTLMSFVYASKNSSTLPETMKMKIRLNRILGYRGPEVT